MPMRNITVLMTANSAPAIPPLPGIFDMLICGVAAFSFILAPPDTRISNLRLQPSHLQSRAELLHQLRSGGGLRLRRRSTSGVCRAPIRSRDRQGAGFDVREDPV